MFSVSIHKIGANRPPNGKVALVISNARGLHSAVEKFVAAKGGVSSEGKEALEADLKTCKPLLLMIDNSEALSKALIQDHKESPINYREAAFALDRILVQAKELLQSRFIREGNYELCKLSSAVQFYHFKTGLTALQTQREDEVILRSLAKLNDSFKTIILLRSENCNSTSSSSIQNSVGKRDSTDAFEGITLPAKPPHTLLRAFQEIFSLNAANKARATTETDPEIKSLMKTAERWRAVSLTLSGIAVLGVTTAITAYEAASLRDAVLFNQIGSISFVAAGLGVLVSSFKFLKIQEKLQRVIQRNREIISFPA